MKILVTGGAGYIGSILVRKLLESGHEVTVYDYLYFGAGALEPIQNNSKLTLITADIRDRVAMEKAIAGQEAVIHLAAIVGDPACAAAADLAVEVNFNATVTVAELAKKAGIKRFVFASTCSVYGASSDTVDENSEFNPVSLYAQTRLYGERGIRALQEGDFRPVFLRLGTVYGISPRMRFDLVVNYLTLKLFREGSISIFGGEQWRPLIHVSDAAAAFQMAVEAPAEKVDGEVFNVGTNEHNFQLKDLIPIFQKVAPAAKIVRVEGMDDKRSYRVNFDKIARVLDFHPAKTVEGGIKEIMTELVAKRFPEPDNEIYYNHKAILNVPK